VRAQFDATTWAKKLIGLFNRATDERRKPQEFITPRELIDKMPDADRLVLFLDYDGTLFPVVRAPHLAVPDRALLLLLRQVTTTEHLELHIVSGRKKEILDEWFGASSIHLHAEQRFNKAAVVKRVMGSLASGCAAIAIGGDLNDDEMREAVPGGMTIAVGNSAAKVRHRLRDPASVRKFLALLAASMRERKRC
jgi:trehalose-6-phosphatase